MNQNTRKAMFQSSRTPRFDLVVATVLIALSALIWWEARKIAPPFYDPLGSAALPHATAILITALALMVAVRALFVLRCGAPIVKPDYRRRPDLAIGITVLAAAYIGIMDFGIIGFPWATMAFIFLSGAVLGGFDRRIMAVSVLLAVLLGGGCAYLFRYVFYIDLPF